MSSERPFRYVIDRKKIEKAVEAVAESFRSQLGTPVRLKPDGAIDDDDASDIEANIRTVLAGYERRPRLVVRVDRSVNLAIEKRIVLRWELDGKPITPEEAEAYLQSLGLGETR